MAPHRITILTDRGEEPIGGQIKAILKREDHYEVDVVGLNEGLKVVPELVIAILPPSTHVAEKLLPKLTALHADVPILPVISSENLNKRDALCLGSHDFLVSPIREPELHARIKRLLRGCRELTSNKIRGRVTQRVELPQLVGEEAGFVVLKRKIPLVAQSEFTTLITGETGTGKELCARAVHYLSRRADKPFLPVNCGAIPVELFERELFGHQKGAFTSAWTAQPGLIAEAEGGTLFLDEIETLSFGAQAKLLRFLQDQTYCVLGSPKLRKANVRVIASTNVDLTLKAQEGSFREDLLYRLAVLVINLPPLRERPGDVPLLVEHFWKMYAENNSGIKKHLSQRAVQALCCYSWPGNVRELESMIQRLLVMSEAETIEPRDLPILTPPPSSESGNASFNQAKAKVIEQFVRTYIKRLLERHQGNVTHAAQEAKKDRRALGRLIKKYQIPKR